MPSFDQAIKLLLRPPMGHTLRKPIKDMESKDHPGSGTRSPGDGLRLTKDPALSVTSSCIASASKGHPAASRSSCRTRTFLFGPRCHPKCPQTLVTPKLEAEHQRSATPLRTYSLPPQSLHLQSSQHPWCARETHGAPGTWAVGPAGRGRAAPGR